MKKKYENLFKIQQNTQNFNFLDHLYWDWSIVWITWYAYWSYWKGSWDGPNAFIFSEILFQDLTFSGIALLIVNGITNIVASIFLFLNKKIGAILGGIFGVTLMLWICIQFYVTIYFIFGFCQAVIGYDAIIFWKQEHFVIDYSKYNNIGTNPKKIVVYFSRMGYTKTIAL